MKPVLKRRRKGRRINHKVLVRAAIISSVVMTIAFILAFLFSQYTNNIAARIIDKLIERRSEGIYQIKYDNLSYNFFDQVLTINNLYFSQDTLSSDSKLPFFKNEDNAFDAYVPYLYLNVKDIWSVYLKKELKITGIRMFQPDIEIISYKEKSGVEWQQDAGSLYDLVSNHLLVFKIDMLAVENGHFTFLKKVEPKRQYEISNISFTIKNFLLDEEASLNKEKFFYTDDIDVEMSDQTFHLKDSIHTLSFKKLLFSTTRSAIEIDSLVIADKSKEDQGYEKTDVFNVYVPKINIKNIDFTSAYNEGLLRIGNVQINFPEISISDKPKTSEDESIEKQKKNRIARLAIDYFNNIRIDSFNLKNADFAYVFESPQRSQGFTLDSFNVMLTNFVLDSSNIRETQRPIYYDDIEFSIKDYQFNLPDSIHILTFSLATGSTKDRLIRFDELRINPRRDINVRSLLKKSDKNKTYNIYLPSAELRRVGHNFLNSDTVKISELILNKPDIQVVEYPDIELDSNKDIDLKDPYPLISDLVDAAYLDKLVLKNGHFTLNRLNERLVPVAIMENFNLDLADIKIDSSSRRLNRFLAAKNMELRTGKIIFEDPKSHFFANTELLYYSSSNRMTRLFESELVLDTFYTDQAIRSQRIKFHKADISGLDINTLWEKQRKVIQKIYLENPVANLHIRKKEGGQNESDLKHNFDDFEIRDFDVKDGNIYLDLEDRQTFSAKSLHLDIKNIKRDTSLLKNYSIGKYSFKASEISFQDEKENTKYFSKALSYDYDKANLSIKNIDIWSGSTQKDQDHYQLKIPQCDISQWKPIDLYLKREMLSGHISVKKPILTLSQGYHPEKEYIPPAELLSILAKKVKAQEISVTDGYLDLKKRMKDDSLFFTSKSFDITISKFDFDSLKQNLNFLFSEDISTSFLDNQLVFQKSHDTLRINAIHNSTYAKSLWFDGVSYNGENRNEKSVTDFTIDKIYLKNIDYKQLQEKQLLVEDILLFQPSVDIRPISAGESKNKVRDLLFLNHLKLDSTLLKTIKIGAIDLKSGLVNIDLPDSIYEDQLSLENLEVHFDNFLLDKDPSQKIFRSDKAFVSFDGFSYNFPDDLNKFSTDKIIISFSDSALTLKKPHYYPVVGKYEYAGIVGKQTDFLDIKSEYVTLSGIDFFELFSQKNIDARKLDVNQLEIHAFRDKRISRKDEPVKPLPQDLIKQIKYGLTIDTASVNQSTIKYEELDPKALTPGIVDFSNLNATLTNITNVDSIIKIRPYLYMNASAFFMNGGTLRTHFRFDLQSEEREFSLSATLDEMDLTHFNKILEPNAFVKIKQGENEKLRMSAEGNENVTVGNMIFEYNDLKISLISKNTFDSKGMGPVLGSFFANTFIIKRSNPSILVTREGNIYFERNPYRSMFNYWAKTFFSGIVSSIGAKSNKKEIKKYEKMENKLSDDDE